MASATPPETIPQETVVVVRRRHPALTVAIWSGVVLFAIILLLGALLAWLNTESGRRYVVSQINAFETVSGLQVGVERIEGSVFGELTLRGITLRDPQGVFFYAPEAELD